MEKQKTELARQYLTKYIDLALKHNRQYSKRFIAEILFNENPDVYKHFEDARFFIRRVTHSAGTEFKAKTDQDIARRFALIPEQVREVDNTEPFIIPTTIRRSLWITDIHGLFYDRRAFETAVNAGVKYGCDSVIILGDFMDFYQDSKFDKNPLLMTRLFEEREWGQDLLSMLQDVFGYVVLKQGNHDVRRERHVWRMAKEAPELVDMAKYSDYLFFDGCTVNFVEDYRHINYGKLNAIHGHEYQGGGIHVAYNRFHKALDNLISGHSHRAQSMIKSDINGQIYGSWSLGCLCELHPRYAPKNDWSHGFALSEKDSSGEFEIENKVIYKNKTFSV